MKISLDEQNYIELNEEKEEVSLSIKTKKDKTTTVLITAKLNSDHLDKLIANLVAMRARM